MRLTGNFEKKLKKIRKFFFSIFSFLRAFVVSSCRKSGFRVFLSLRYGADLGRSRLVSIETIATVSSMFQKNCMFLRYIFFQIVSTQCILETLYKPELILWFDSDKSYMKQSGMKNYSKGIRTSVSTF